MAKKKGLMIGGKLNLGKVPRIGKKIKMGKVPSIGAKLDFNGGFLPKKSKARKVKGKWTYNDTRDYRFDPDMFKI
jgi:hypothetical protein